MRVKLLVTGALLVFVGGIVGFISARAGASGIPVSNPMTYSGVLTDTSGTPLVGSKNIQIFFWDAGQDGNQVCIVPSASQTLVSGAFQIELPDECSSAVHSNPNIWAEVFVDGESLGRSKLGAVPFALEADHAAKASQATGDLKTVLASLQAGKVGAQDTSGKPLRICSGSTPIGNTKWKPYGDGNTVDIVVDVDTSACKFTSTPIYLSVLNGDNNHWTTTGGSNAYSATTSGFRVYVRDARGITPENANSRKWHIEWIALGK